MSRPWMPLYVADYLADTGHLNCAEHGAYLLLIMHYWQKGGLPADDRKLASIARALPKQWLSIKPAIKEFFDDEWRHNRIENELEMARLAHERRETAGRKGGLKTTKDKEHCSSNPKAMRNHARVSLNSQSQSQIEREERKTNPSGLEKESQPTKPSPLEILKTALSEKTAQDLIDHRKAKRSPLTPRAAEGLVAAFRDHGDPERAAEAMIVNGWQGFKPEWMARKPPIRAGPNGGHQGPITAFNRPSMREHIRKADEEAREAKQKFLELEAVERKQKNDP